MPAHMPSHPPLPRHSSRSSDLRQSQKKHSSLSACTDLLSWRKLIFFSGWGFKGLVTSLECYATTLIVMRKLRFEHCKWRSFNHLCFVLVGWLDLYRACCWQEFLQRLRCQQPVLGLIRGGTLGYGAEQTVQHRRNNEFIISYRSSLNRLLPTLEVSQGTLSIISCHNFTYEQQ